MIIVSCWILVVLDSIVVSILACHVRDPGSIPGRGGNIFIFFDTENTRDGNVLLAQANKCALTAILTVSIVRVYALLMRLSKQTRRKYISLCCIKPLCVSYEHVYWYR